MSDITNILKKTINNNKSLVIDDLQFRVSCEIIVHNIRKHGMLLLYCHVHDKLFVLFLLRLLTLVVTKCHLLFN